MIQKRSIGVCILLSIITCGIYGFYWMYCINQDAETVSGSKEVDGGMLILLIIVTCGIYGIFWLYKTGNTLETVNGRNGSLGILCLVLSILGLSLISIALLQNELNSISDSWTTT